MDIIVETGLFRYGIHKEEDHMILISAEAPCKFFGEQYRVLKDDGVCLVLCARRGINVLAPCISEQTEFEKELWNRTEKYYSEANKKYSVCAYPLNEAELH